MAVHRPAAGDVVEIERPVAVGAIATDEPISTTATAGSAFTGTIWEGAPGRREGGRSCLRYRRHVASRVRVRDRFANECEKHTGRCGERPGCALLRVVPGTAPSTLRTTAPASRLRRMPGIDGLRAIAVAAVFVYHANSSWLPGGSSAVDVFFVISGYLITSLLIAELAQTGRVRLGRFWAGRARRLLPALFLMLGVCLLIGSTVERGKLVSLRGDALSSIFYFANWRFIFEHESYFVQFRPDRRCCAICGRSPSRSSSISCGRRSSSSPRGCAGGRSSPFSSRSPRSARRA